MRLRYLHLQNYPPIDSIALCLNGDSALARESAMRFVVGVNGSGKSNLLRAVAEVFLALADLRVPAFPVTLVYELGLRGTSNHRTLLLHCPGPRDRGSLWLHERAPFADNDAKEKFEACIENLNVNGVPSIAGFSALIAPGEWPFRDSTPPQIALPSAVLAYTTGDLRPWRSVWNRNQDGQGLLESAEDDSDEQERPAGWTVAQEMAYQAARPTQSAVALLAPRPSMDTGTFRRPVLLDSTLLKCALLAVVLRHGFIETNENHQRGEAGTTLAGLVGNSNDMSFVQDLLVRGDWHQLVSVMFRSHLQPTNWSSAICDTAHDWWLCAGEVIAEPHPIQTRRVLAFDLKGQFSGQDLSTQSSAGEELASCTTQGEALWVLLGGGRRTTPFDVFTRLLELNQKGLFDDMLLRIRRRPAPPARTDDARRDLGVMRYEELSDGEQMYLGRMALFHLLSGQHDSLLLLDEPETHFNDLWKRDVVSVVDDALAGTSAEVWIATHAALMLTDALKDELVVLERTSPNDAAGPTESGVRTLDAQTRTFGATGDHPLRDVFGAPDTVGRRASRLLEVLIASASFSDEVEAAWRSGDSFDAQLVGRILERASQTASGLTHAGVVADLKSIVQFAHYFGAMAPLTMKVVLEIFIQQTGPGYFQVELKRAWRRLREDSSHVA